MMLPLPFNIGKVEDLLSGVTASNIALCDAVIRLADSIDAAADQQNRRTQADRKK